MTRVNDEQNFLYNRDSQRVADQYVTVRAVQKKALGKEIRRWNAPFPDSL